MSAESTRLVNALKKITQPLFGSRGSAQQKILRQCFPHPHEEGMAQLVGDDPTTSPSRKHPDSELERVNACVREIYHCPFSCAQKGRLLNSGEPPDVALFHLKAQALYTKLYQAAISNLVFYSNPGTPGYESYPHCWLQWRHKDQCYLLDPINYDCAIALEAAN